MALPEGFDKGLV